MPEAIANLAPPCPPRTPPKASAKPESAPAKRGFEEELERASALADDPQPTAQAVEPDAESPEEQLGEPSKPPKASLKKPPVVEPDLTVTMQPQAPPVSDYAVIDADAESPSADATLLPLTTEIAIERPLESPATEEPNLPEDLAEFDISATIRLPPPTADAAPVSTITLPPALTVAPDTAAPVEATPPPTPSPDRAPSGQESFSATAPRPTPPDTAASSSPLPDDNESPAPLIEAIDDPSAQVTYSPPARETPTANPTDQSLDPVDTPEPRFTDDNHPRIITALRSNVSSNGGSVTIRLDPPGLGEVQVSVELRDGMMIASIQTSTDDATRLMSHSLGQLKRSLESSGLAVEKLQVQQAPRDEQGGRPGDERPGQQHHNDGRSAQQQQQRREILERVWRRLRGGRDPIDFLI